jgi:hypothetical protein
MIRGPLACGKSFEGGAINQENVRPAIVVVVEDGAPVPVVSMMYFLVSLPPKTPAMLTRLFRHVGKARSRSWEAKPSLRYEAAQTASTLSNRTSR